MTATPSAGIPAPSNSCRCPRREEPTGRASYTMEFSHYEPVPRNVTDEIVAGRNKAA